MRKSIVYLNGYSQGSTATFCATLSNLARKAGWFTCFIGPDPCVHGNAFDQNFGVCKKGVQHLISRGFTFLNDSECFANARSTRKLFDILDTVQPAIVHLNNLHGTYISFPKLVSYAAKRDIQLVWTLHDCWLATGRCCCFDMHGCMKWREGCGACPHKNATPKTLLDRSKQHWHLKHKIVDSTQNLVLCSPSQWLANILKQSKVEKAVSVYPNGINLDVFKPSQKDERVVKSALGRNVIGFVFARWTKEKGSDFAVELCNKIDHKKYFVVLVGAPDNLRLTNALVLPKAKSPKELRMLYSSFDVTANFTLEDNFPTINMESIACGTPVLTFDTGGSPESIKVGINGFVVRKGDVEAVIKCLPRILKLDRNIVAKSSIEFDASTRYASYLYLYKRLLQSGKKG